MSAGHQRDLVDNHTGDVFDQPAPYGPVHPVRKADYTAPSSQRPRTWEHWTASGRDLRPAS